MHLPVACSDCRNSPTWSWHRTVDPAVVCEAAGLPPAPLESVETEPAYYPGRPDWITVTAGGRSARMPVVDFRAAVSRGRPRGDQLLSTRWAALPRVEPEGLVVDGHGWGHGVGLCQYGAGGYARRGAGYRVILRRYYPGAELVQLL
jgi:stage II sporulation protein D